MLALATHRTPFSPQNVLGAQVANLVQLARTVAIYITSGYIRLHEQLPTVKRSMALVGAPRDIPPSATARLPHFAYKPVNNKEALHIKQ